MYLSDPLVQDLAVFAVEFFKATFVQRFSYALHEGVVEPEIVHHREPHAEHLLRLLQMADVGAGMSLTDGTVAGAVDGGVILFIFRVVDIDDAVPCK